MVFKTGDTMNIFCKIFGHKTVKDNSEDGWLTGAVHCTRKGCNYKRLALNWPKPPIPMISGKLTRQEKEDSEWITLKQESNGTLVSEQWEDSVRKEVNRILKESKMTLWKFEFGDLLRDKVTNYEGYCLGRSEYSTGCRHYGMLAEGETKEGKLKEWEWFDESRLEVAHGKMIDLNTKKPEGGPQPNPGSC